MNNLTYHDIPSFEILEKDHNDGASDKHNGLQHASTLLRVDMNCLEKRN